MKIFSPIHLKNLLNMIGLSKLSLLFLFALITACGGFNTGVKKSDTQKLTQLNMELSSQLSLSKLLVKALV